MTGKFFCYSGLSLPDDIIQKWKKQKYLVLEGYRSTSLEEKVARNFANINETDYLERVILVIEMENKHNKYFICLDKAEFTLYPDEKEILL